MLANTHNLIRAEHARALSSYESHKVSECTCSSREVCIRVMTYYLGQRDSLETLMTILGVEKGE